MISAFYVFKFSLIVNYLWTNIFTNNIEINPIFLKEQLMYLFEIAAISKTTTATFMKLPI